MVGQGLALVGLVLAVGTVKLEDASMSVFAILHLVKAHVAMATLITPGNRVGIKNQGWAVKSSCRGRLHLGTTLALDSLTLCISSLPSQADFLKPRLDVEP